MKILFATSHAYLPQRTGGSETVTHDLCLTLKMSGDSPGVISSLGSNGLIYPVNRIKTKIGIGRAPARDTVMSYPVYRYWNPIEAFEDCVSHFLPDVVVAQAGEPASFARAAVALGVPCVVYLHDTLDSDTPSKNFKELPSVRFVANSQFTANFWKAKASIEASILPPYVRRNKYLVEPKGEFVTFVNPVPMKGLERAVSMAQACPDIPFLFVEGWPLGIETKRALRRRLKEFPNVTWRDRTSDMRTVYSNTKILLVPSICEEAWGRVITEAQLSGIPAIASNLGGIPEAVGRGGILLDPFCQNGVWEAELRALWSDGERYDALSSAAYENCLQPEIAEEALFAKFLDVCRAAVVR